MSKPPAPLEWHPWYRDKTFLLDWLETADPVVLIPPIPVSRYLVDPSPYPITAETNHVVLTKRKAYGPAPYVGRPFVYMWRCAVDQYGRGIAGESRIVYTQPDYGVSTVKLCPEHKYQQMHGQDVGMSFHRCLDCRMLYNPDPSDDILKLLYERLVDIEKRLDRIEYPDADY